MGPTGGGAIFTGAGFYVAGFTTRTKAPIVAIGILGAIGGAADIEFLVTPKRARFEGAFI